MQGVLAIDAITAVVGISSLLVVAIPRPSRAAAGVATPSFWRDLREGMDYVRGWSGLMAILIMATVINFFLVAAASLMPILVTVHFGGKMMHLATLESIFGGGAIIGGVTLGVWGGFRPRILTSLAGLVGIGIGFLLMGLTPANQFGMGLASAFLAAAMIPMTNGPIMAVLQATVAPGMQGRVFSLITGVVTAIAPVGLAIAGPMADWLGVRAWYVAGGVVCAGMGVVGFFIPAIRRIEEHVQSPVTTA